MMKGKKVEKNNNLFLDIFSGDMIIALMAILGGFVVSLYFSLLLQGPIHARVYFLLPLATMLNATLLLPIPVAILTILFMIILKGNSNKKPQQTAYINKMSVFDNLNSRIQNKKPKQIIKRFFVVFVLVLRLTWLAIPASGLGCLIYQAMS